MHPFLLMNKSDSSMPVLAIVGLLAMVLGALYLLFDVGGQLGWALGLMVAGGAFTLRHKL
jgi:hypothetical protein